MANFYYNDVLLPEIPQDALSEYPYQAILRSNGNNVIYAYGFKSKVYRNSATNKIAVQERYRLAYDSNSDSWDSGKAYTNTSTLALGDANYTLLWSNHDIPNDSADATDIYFYGSDPVPEGGSEPEVSVEYGILTEPSSYETASSNLESGWEFTVGSEDINVLGLRIKLPSVKTSNGKLWSSDGTLLRSVSITTVANEWVEAYFDEPITLTAGNNYVISALPNGNRYYATSNGVTFNTKIIYVIGRFNGTVSVSYFPKSTSKDYVVNLIDIIIENNVPDEPDEPEEPDEPSIRTSGYLIQSGDSLFTVTDGVLTAVEGSVNAELFRTYGVDEIPASDLLVTLTDPVVLYWVDTTEYEITPLVAMVQGVPFTQTIESKDYYMTNDSILGIEKVLVDASDDVRFAISFNSGLAWKMHTGEAWATLTENDTGMSASVMSAITTEEWNMEATTGKFRFRITIPSSDSYLNSLVVDYLN